MVEFVTNRTLYWGSNALKNLEEILVWNNKKNVFLAVYDRNAQCVPIITQQIANIGGTCVIYDSIIGEPDLETVDTGVEIYLQNNCDCAIAVGGGSVIDTAKAISVISANGGKTVDYQLNGKEITKKANLFIAVPTTAGTGSEATKVSVVTNNEKGFKKAFYHTSMIADIVILDSELTKNLPPKIMASTGIDALTHAIESYVSKNSNTISKMYSLQAIKLISENLEIAVLKNTEEARSNMLLGSYFAGFGISASIGFAHFFGMAIGGMYHIPHGDACSIFLPASMKFNLDYALDDYVEIAKALGISTNDKTPYEIANEGIQKVEKIRHSVKATELLTEFIDSKNIDFEAIIDNVNKSTGHLKCNPRECEPNVLREILSTVI